MDKEMLKVNRKTMPFCLTACCYAFQL